MGVARQQAEVRRRYVGPSVRSREELPPPALLACSGPGPSFDCSPIVGFPCCKSSDRQCDKCRP